MDQFFERVRDSSEKSTTPDGDHEKIPSIKVPPIKINALGFHAEIVLVMRSGKILLTSTSLDETPKDFLDGSIFEVMLPTADGDPYFVYYKSDDYYQAAQQIVGISSQGRAFVERCENWRKAVSIKSAQFLAKYLSAKFQSVPRIVSYSHNRKHTNVLAYVSSLGNWYPIHHNDREPDNATEAKVSMVNRGLRSINDFIAIREESPS